MPALETFEFDLASGQSSHAEPHQLRPQRTTRRAWPSRPPDGAPPCCWPRQIRRSPSTLSTPDAPRLVGRIETLRVPRFPTSRMSADSDWIMMPVASPSEAIAIESPRKTAEAHAGTSLAIPRPDYVICTRHRESVVELLQNSPLYPLGRLPLTGPLNIGRTRPTGLCLLTRARPARRLDSLGLDSLDRASLARQAPSPRRRTGCHRARRQATQIAAAVHFAAARSLARHRPWPVRLARQLRSDSSAFSRIALVDPSRSLLHRIPV